MTTMAGNLTLPVPVGTGSQLTATEVEQQEGQAMKETSSTAQSDS